LTFGLSRSHPSLFKRYKTSLKRRQIEENCRDFFLGFGALLSSFFKIFVLGLLIFKLLEFSDFSFKFWILSFQDFDFSRICDSKF
jgi:hypothetical protein